MRPLETDRVCHIKGLTKLLASDSRLYITPIINKSHVDPFEVEKVMKRKPDILIILAVLLGIGMVLSSYTIDDDKTYAEVSSSKNDEMLN